MSNEKLSLKTLSNEQRLAVVLCLSLLIFAAEVVGGLISNSLALLSDAGHVLTDAFAIGLSLLALLVARRPSDFRATYGYQRVGLLAAVINGVSLLAIAIFIFYEAYERLLSPPDVEAPIMIGIGAAGLLGNVMMALILGKGHRDLNIKSAWLHILGDLLASVGVVIAGVVIFVTGIRLADPIAGFLVGVLILVGGIRVVKDSLWVFLELTPSGLNVEEISKKIQEIPDVQGLHDVHLWSISHGAPAFSAHVWVTDQKLSQADEIRSRIEGVLRKFGILHTVLQLECAECEESGLYCQVRTEQYHHHHE